MDLTEKYIQMCEKAKELHDEEIQDGDFVVIKNGIKLEVTTVGEYTQGMGSKEIRNENDINGDDTQYEQILFKLFRQDQLQEILGVDSYRWFELCWQFVMDEPLPLSSEMVALELVMITKFNKTWNGEDWV